MFWETARETGQLMHAAPPSSALSYPSTDARCLIGSSDRIHWPNSLDTGMARRYFHWTDDTWGQDAGAGGGTAGHARHAHAPALCPSSRPALDHPRLRR